MAEAPDFGTLARRFRSLRLGDRRAVLASFSAEDRTLFEQALAEEIQAHREEEERRLRTDKQFRCYSPWLADLIAATLAEPDAPTRLTHAGARALAAQHQALVDGSAGDGQPGLLASARRAWQALIGETPGGAR